METVTRGSGILESFLSNQRVRMANKLIPRHYRGGRILDIGCGSYPNFLLNTEFCHKYGIDKTVCKLNRAFQENHIDVENYDIETGDLPFDDEYFDVVSMLAVFEHIDPERLVLILKEIRRVLKMPGIYILTTPAPWTDKLLKLMASVKLVSSEEIEEHKGAYSPLMISSFLQQASFRPENIKFGFFELSMNIWCTATK